MPLRNCITSDVQHANPDTLIVDVAKRMKDYDCGSILVSENDKLIGVITDRDIVLRCIADSQDPVAMTAQQCMSPEILYCYETAEPEDVLKNMADNGVRRMPVVDADKNLVGIVSFGDLAEACDDKKAAGEAMEQIKMAA